MMPIHHIDRWRHQAARAFNGGATIDRSQGDRGPARLVWNVAGRCEAPVYRELLGAAPAPADVRYKPNQDVKDLRDLKTQSSVADKFRTDIRSGRWRRGPVHVIELWVKCRKCSECLRAKAFHWRMRASAELANSPGRAWFSTFTFSPQEHWKAEGRARLRLARRGVNWADLSEPERFSERCAETGRELTLYLKRLRKESGARLRYCLIAEAHKSGLPHWHMLLHEAEGTVRHATLKRQWTLGFSDHKLVAESDENRAASYVTKYLTKSASARVRASRGYGHQADQNALGPSVSEKTRVKNPDPPPRRSHSQGRVTDNASELSDQSEGASVSGVAGQTLTAGGADAVQPLGSTRQVHAPYAAARPGVFARIAARTANAPANTGSAAFYSWLASGDRGASSPAPASGRAGEAVEAAPTCAHPSARPLVHRPRLRARARSLSDHGGDDRPG